MLTDKSIQFQESIIVDDTLPENSEEGDLQAFIEDYYQDLKTDQAWKKDTKSVQKHSVSQKLHSHKQFSIHDTSRKPVNIQTGRVLGALQISKGVQDIKDIIEQLNQNVIESDKTIKEYENVASLVNDEVEKRIF